MTDLFKLTMRRKVLVSRFDTKGHKTGETESFVEEVYNDLPSSTCASYRKTFPDAFVAAVPMEREYARHGHATARTQFDKAPAKRREAPPAASAPVHEGIVGVDYAAAVMAAVAREARS